MPKEPDIPGWRRGSGREKGAKPKLRAPRQASGGASTLTGPTDCRRRAKSCASVLRLQLRHRRNGCVRLGPAEGEARICALACGVHRPGAPAAPKPHDPRVVGPRLWCKQPLPEVCLRCAENSLLCGRSKFRLLFCIPAAHVKSKNGTGNRAPYQMLTFCPRSIKAASKVGTWARPL